MTTLVSALTNAYPRRWTSRDVREGNCSLDLCGSPKRRKPNGELIKGRFESMTGSTVVYYDPEDVLEHIFGDNYGVVNTYHGATLGKVDAPEARRLWEEWQVRTGRHGRPYAYQFLREVGLPVCGGPLIRGELAPELAEASGITEAAYRRALDARTFYVHIEETSGGERGMFLTCQQCRWKRIVPTKYVHFHSPWQVTFAGIEKKLAELAASSFYNHPPRKVEWDCSHVAAQ